MNSYYVLARQAANQKVLFAKSIICDNVKTTENINTAYQFSTAAAATETAFHLKDWKVYKLTPIKKDQATN